MSFAVFIQIPQPCLSAVRARQPAEQVIEAAVLHHHDDDVFDL
jgi:hypothetical protein